MADDPQKPGGGGALGFSLAAKPKRGKVQVQVQERREERQLITGIDAAGRIEAAEPDAPAAGPRVIAAMGNTYRAGVGRAARGGAAGAGGFAPSFVPPSSEDGLNASNTDKFVAAPQDDGTKPAVTQYGLQRMDGRAAAAAAQQQQEAAANGGAPGPPAGGGPAEPNGGAGRGGPAVPGFNLAARAGGGGGRGDNKAALMEELQELPEEMAPGVSTLGGWRAAGGLAAGGSRRQAGTASSRGVHFGVRWKRLSLAFCLLLGLLRCTQSARPGPARRRTRTPPSRTLQRRCCAAWGGATARAWGAARRRWR